VRVWAWHVLLLHNNIIASSCMTRLQPISLLSLQTPHPGPETSLAWYSVGIWSATYERWNLAREWLINGCLAVLEFSNSASTGKRGGGGGPLRATGRRGLPQKRRLGFARRPGTVRKMRPSLHFFISLLFSLQKGFSLSPRQDWAPVLE